MVRILSMSYLAVLVLRRSSDINQAGSVAMLTIYCGYSVGYLLQWFWGIMIFRGALKLISSKRSTKSQ